MKKILIPIITAASLAATISPLLSSCGNGGWIEWDFTKGEYQKHKVTPLTYSADVNPAEEAFKWFSEDKNNIVYDFYNFVNTQLPSFVDTEMNKFSGKFKINSYDSNKHTVNFESEIEVDILNHDGKDSTDLERINTNIVAKNVSLDIKYHSELGKWELFTPISNFDKTETKTFLASGESGDWSITGNYSYYSRIEENGHGYVVEYSDYNFNYNKSTLDAIFDDDKKADCLKDTYCTLDHPLYYLQEFNNLDE